MTTFIELWDEFTPGEREMIVELLQCVHPMGSSISMGTLALMKPVTVFKCIDAIRVKHDNQWVMHPGDTLVVNGFKLRDATTRNIIYLRRKLNHVLEKAH